MRKSEKLIGGFGEGGAGEGDKGRFPPLLSRACVGAIWIQAHEINKGFVFVGFGFHFS